MRWATCLVLAGLLGCWPQPLDEPAVGKQQMVLVQQQIPMPQLDEIGLRILNTVLAAGHTYDEYLCLRSIAVKESGLNPHAVGDGGDSHGLWQRHTPSWGRSQDDSVEEQTRWALAYANRYGGPCQAWEAWQKRAATRGGKGWW